MLPRRPSRHQGCAVVAPVSVHTVIATFPLDARRPWDAREIFALCMELLGDDALVIRVHKYMLRNRSPHGERGWKLLLTVMGVLPRLSLTTRGSVGSWATVRNCAQ